MGERLVRVPLDRLRPHPANANQMSAERLETLARNIARTGEYPPLVARPHPDEAGAWQILDGHQRLNVLSCLGHTDALVFAWPCDDETALLLLATLNRLEGEDVPAKRAELLRDLQALMPVDELVALLPEDAHALEELLGLLALDPEALLADLTRSTERCAAEAPQALTFAVPADEVSVVEAAVAAAAAALEGKNRRGRALGAVCRAYLEGRDGAEDPNP